LSVKRPGFHCRACGYRSAKWLGRCPECGAWATLEPLTEQTEPASDTAPATAVPFPEIDGVEADRLPFGIGELDRVLGGGLVAGSVVLVGGEPGIGKSTLLLQSASTLAAAGHRVLYVSGEESAAQIALRGRRLEVESPHLLVSAETDVGAIIAAARELQPELLIVDSVQAVRCPDVESVPGSVTQVREVASRFVAWAKTHAIPVVLVGHVTKDGVIAGPRVLEHLVDTVIQFEGDRHHAQRLLRALKNRFGPTDELGVFGMTDRGLVEIANPSALFLPERPSHDPGSAVLATIEGTRPLLVEIQALVGEPGQGSPRRTVLGVDDGRVAMILAVLQRQAGLQLVQRDVFVNVTGGLSVTEPAADLAVAVAVASSLARKAPAGHGIVLGEIGLTGEIRPVGGVDARLRVAARMGFREALIPAEGYPTSPPGDLRTTPVRRVAQALDLLFSHS